MSGWALGLWVIYLLVAFVLRGYLQWRNTGDLGFRLGSEAVGSSYWWARIGFVFALVLSAMAPVADLAGWVEPVAALDAEALATLGAVLAMAGIAGTFVAQLAMGASWRVGVDPGERTELVDQWPFTVVRNPIFSMMGVTGLGLAILVPSWMSIAGFVLLVVALRFQVLVVEEPYLRRVHGEQYVTYTHRVGRFVPGLRRLD